DLRQRASAESFGSRREPATLVIRETKSATAELLAQHPILLAQIVDCLLLLLIHPARDGNQHEPKRVENAHCSTVSWALCIVFNAFDFLDNTASRTASFRLRAAHSGGEDRRLAEWRRPLRTPAVALLASPADPWPTKGASGMRDSRSERTSRAG